MAMKKKNSLPDMYSPEKKFSGFLCIGILEPKNKKRTGKSSFKKIAKKSRYEILYFILLHISHIVQKASGKAAA